MGAFDDLIPGSSPSRRRSSAFADLIPAGAPAPDGGPAEVESAERAAVPAASPGIAARLGRVFSSISAGRKQLGTPEGGVTDVARQTVEGRITPLEVDLAGRERPGPNMALYERAKSLRAKQDRPTVGETVGQPIEIGGGTRAGAVKEIPGLAMDTLAEQYMGLKRLAGEVGADLGVPGAQTMAAGAAQAARDASQRSFRRMAPFKTIDKGEVGPRLAPERDLAEWFTEPENIAAVGQQVPQLAGVAASLLGAPTGVTLLTTMGLPVMGQSYHQYREQGYDAPIALLGAMGQATAETVPEVAWVKFARRTKLGSLSGFQSMPLEQQQAVVKGLLKGYGIIAGSEVAQEEVSTIGNFLVDAAMQNPEATLEQLGKDMKDTLRQTALFAPGMAGAAHVGQLLQRKALETPTGRAAVFADELQKAVEGADLAGESPTVSRETTARVAPQADIAAAIQHELEAGKREAAMAEDAARAGGDENRYDTLIAQNMARLLGEREPRLPAVDLSGVPTADESRATREGVAPFGPEDLPGFVGRRGAAVSELEPDLTGGASPLAGTVSSEEARERLGRAVARDAGAGAPQNPRTVLRDKEGTFVVGQVTPEDWRQRVRGQLTHEELVKARQWYRQLHATLTPIYGEESPRIALAWLMSQQRASPSKGFQDVLRARDKVQGRGGDKIAGLNEKSLKAILSGQQPEGGIGAKLHDFLDSELGLGTRTIMGRDKRGGQPAAIDIWALRDHGRVDQGVLNYVRQRFGEKAAARIKEEPAGLTEAGYEYGSRFYNDLAADLNRRRFNNGKWSASEAQAVGWVAMQKAMGVKAETVEDIVGKNTRRVSLGLEPGAGSGGKALSAEQGENLAQTIAKAVGANVVRVERGQGAYLTQQEGAVQIDALASPEVVSDFLNALGYAARQTSVIGTRALKSGRQDAIDVISPELVDPAKAASFWQAFMAAPGMTEIAPGYQQVQLEGQQGLRLLNFGGHWSQRQLAKIEDALNAAAEATGVEVSDVLHFPVELQEASHDWQKDPSGKTYLDSLRKRGRDDLARELERQYGQQGPGYRGARTIRRGLDQDVGKQPSRPVATAALAVAYDNAFPPKRARRGHCHQLAWRKVTEEGDDQYQQVIGVTQGINGKKIWHSVAYDPKTGNIWEPISNRWYTPAAMEAFRFEPVFAIGAEHARRIAMKEMYYPSQETFALKGSDKQYLERGDYKPDLSIFSAGPSSVGKREPRQIVNRIRTGISPEQKVEDLKKLSAENRPLIDNFLQQLDAELGTTSKSSLKLPERILEKSRRPSIKSQAPWFDVEHVRDSLRFKSVLGDITQLPKAARMLRDAGWEIVKVDTPKVLKPLGYGWRFAGVDLQMPNGQLVEWYMPVKELEAAKKAGNHLLFEKWRNRDLSQLTPTEIQQFEHDVVQSKKSYNAAWKAYLRRTGQSEREVRDALKSFEEVLSSGSPISSTSEAENRMPSSQRPPISERAEPSESTNAREPSGEQTTVATGPIVARNATASPEAVGMKKATLRDLPIGHLPPAVMDPMTDQQLSSVAAAVQDLYDVGLPRYLVEQVKGWVTYNISANETNASYFHELNAIGVRIDHLAHAGKNPKGPTATNIRGWIAHELTHNIDNAGGKSKDWKSFSEESPRLEFEPSDIGEAKMEFNSEADLMVEAVEAYVDGPDALREHLAYPLAAVEQYDKATVKSELFAQMGELYFTDRAMMKKAAPRWYDVMEEIYGKARDQDDTLAAARERLQQALQVEGAGERAAGQRGEGRADDRRGDEARLASRGVGASPPAGARGGAAKPPAANRRGSPAGSRPFQWDVEQPGLGDALTREFQNQQVDLKRVQEAIERAGGVIRESGSPYLSDELYYGRVSDRIHKFQKKTLEPLLKEIKAAGLTAEEVGRYLWARHAPERNAQIAKINAAMGTNGSGMTDAQAQAVMQSFAGKRRELQAIAAKVDAITKETRRILVDEDLEDKDTIANWERAYKNYVPLHRDVDAPREGQGFKISGPEAKRAMGSTRDAIAILSAVVSQHEAAITRAEKARVGRDLIKLAEEFPNEDFWRVDQPPTKRTINPSTGLVQNTIDPLFKFREDVFVVKDRDPQTGKIRERVLSFNPSNERALRVARAMAKLDVVQFGAATRIVGMISRFLANLATQWNPVFWATNFLRDVQTASINLQSTKLRGDAPKVMSRIPQALAGIVDAEFRDGNSTWAKHYREYQAAGGQTGWKSLFEDLIERQRELEGIIKRSGRSAADPRQMARWTVEQISKANTAIENATRLSAYVVAREKGLSEREAASTAKNLTVNFNRKGNRSSVMSAWYMFFNANVQGTARMMQALATSRKAQAMVGSLVMVGALMELLNRLIGDKDKDEAGNNPYELIPEHEKQRNWIIMLPGRNEKGEARRITIPMPYGFNVFPTLGRLVMEQALGAGRSGLVIEKKSPLDAAWDMTTSLFDAFVPLGQSSTPLQIASPTVFDPFVQVAENKTWYGSPLVPKRERYNLQVPRSELYFSSNSELAKDTSQWLNRMTGGNALEPGALDIHPGHIQHAVATATGGTGAFVLGMLDWGRNVTGRALGSGAEPLPSKRVPFLGKFYGEINEREIEAKFYRLKEKADPVYARYRALKKAGDRDAADQLEEKEPALIEFARQIQKSTFVKDRKELNDDMKSTREMPLMDRARAKDQIKRDQSLLYQRAIEAYNSSASEGGR